MSRYSFVCGKCMGRATDTEGECEEEERYGKKGKCMG